MTNCVNDNLYQVRNNLLKEITPLSYTIFNSSPGKNQWSIAQVCHHLVLVEHATRKAISWGLKHDDNIQIKRKNIDVFFDRAKKRKAPPIVEPDRGPFEVQLIIDLLNDSRENLLTFLSTIEDESIFAKKSVRHPSMGELRLEQWIEQIYLHEQHHIEQIKEIKLLLEQKH